MSVLNAEHARRQTSVSPERHVCLPVAEVYSVACRSDRMAKPLHAISIWTRSPNTVV
jgi:hypothetical protein